MRYNIPFINMLTESIDGPRIPHPEDSIFKGSQEAERYIVGLEECMANPAGISIKWDGNVALYFGHTPSGEFFISDKYMYPKGIMAKNVAEWQKYDQEKTTGKTRPDLYKKLQLIWQGLQIATGKTPGVFKCDLMAVGNEIQQSGQEYVFKGPTVEYHIPIASAMGKIITGKVGIVVVHSHDDRPWDGRTGLTNASNVAIFGPTAGIQFKLRTPVQLLTTAKATLQKFGPTADAYLNELTPGKKSALQTYFNKKITAQIDGEYETDNDAGFQAVRAIWNSIYALKVNLCLQLEPQVQGFTQFVNGKPGGEGFVFTSPTVGPIKLVNRGQFGVAHFNK